MNFFLYPSGNQHTDKINFVTHQKLRGWNINHFTPYEFFAWQPIEEKEGGYIDELLYVPHFLKALELEGDYLLALPKGGYIVFMRKFTKYIDQHAKPVESLYDTCWSNLQVIGAIGMVNEFAVYARSNPVFRHNLYRYENGDFKFLG